MCFYVCANEMQTICVHINRKSFWQLYKYKLRVSPAPTKNSRIFNSTLMILSVILLGVRSDL